MEMFLMVVAISVLCFGLSALAFGAATRNVRNPPEQHLAPRPPVPAPRFFVDVPVDAEKRHTHVPIEALLLHIERHVRLEQAAAESFQATPTPEALHVATMSPLVH